MNKYIIIDKIKDGTFGSVYKGQHTITKEYVAIKTSLINEFNNLKNEAKIYQYINRLGVKGFPKLKWYGNKNNINYLVIDYYHLSLSDFVRQKHIDYEIKYFDISIQLIERVEQLHKIDLIHRDIKPDNFLFNDIMVLYLIDFGFCKKYIDENNNHIILENNKKFIGTPNYVSLNIHRGLTPSRRDDLESCVYIIIELFLGNLIWNIFNDLELIYKSKKDYTINNYKYTFLNDLLQYVRKINFDEEPNYNHLKNILVYEKNFYISSNNIVIRL